MAVAAMLRSSFYTEICDFNELVINKIFHFVVFSGINRLLTVKYTSEKLIAK